MLKLRGQQIWMSIVFFVLSCVAGHTGYYYECVVALIVALIVTVLTGADKYYDDEMNAATIVNTCIALSMVHAYYTLPLETVFALLTVFGVWMLAALLVSGGD